VDAVVTGYGCITSVRTENGVIIITYINVTIDQMMAAMDIYNTEPLDGESILEGVDIEALEKSVEQQALDSGFADEAAIYLANLALKTESFTKLSEDLGLTDFQLKSEDGKVIDPGKMLMFASSANVVPYGIGLMAAGGGNGSDGGSSGGKNGKVDVKITKLKASFDTKLKHFNTSGVRLTLDAGVEITITVDDTVIVIDVTGCFEEEVRIDINVSGGAGWDFLWGFLPYIREFEVTANRDFFNYTGTKVDASLVTRSFVDNKRIEFRELANIAGELEKLLNEDKYIGDGNGTVAEGLAEKYRAMLENESGWVTLFEQEIFKYEYPIPPIFIIVVGIEVDFVVSADVSVSLGFDFYYENAKRYSYTLQVFTGPQYHGKPARV